MGINIIFGLLSIVIGDITDKIAFILIIVFAGYRQYLRNKKN